MYTRIGKCEIDYRIRNVEEVRVGLEVMVVILGGRDGDRSGAGEDFSVGNDDKMLQVFLHVLNVKHSYTTSPPLQPPPAPLRSPTTKYHNFHHVSKSETSSDQQFPIGVRLRQATRRCKRLHDTRSGI